jgi:DNA-binding CsgD family transcriptional regulator
LADPLVLVHLLDEVDYGMLLLSADMQVLYRNHAARIELDGEHPLQMVGGGLRTLRTVDILPLSDALAGAQRGLRRLIVLGEGENQVTVSVVPLSSADERDAVQRKTQTLLVLGKRQVCGRLSLQGFARCANLTPAETRVLELLCSGVRPGQISKLQNVAVSTIRTQIGSIRAKTGTTSISALVRQVALLPPMVGALRGMMHPLSLARGGAHQALQAHQAH